MTGKIYNHRNCLTTFLGGFSIILLICFSTIASAQETDPKGQEKVDPKAKEYHDRAYKSAHNYDYVNAIVLAQKAIDIEPEWLKPYMLLADIYHSQQKFVEEKAVYERLKKNAPAEMASYYNLGAVNFELGNYQEALENYEGLLKLPNVPDQYRNNATQRIKHAKFCIDMVNHPVPFDLHNMGSEVNTSDDEYFPAFTVDGETLLFTRRKYNAELPEGHPFAFNEDLMYSKRRGLGWGKAYDVPGEVNTQEYNEGAVAIAPDGSFMVFTGCNWKNGYGGCDLYISFLKDGDWTKPVNMLEPVNSRFGETQPSISFDGRSIYFASNRPGTYGQYDIWVTTRDDKWNFGKPVNLGPVINTPESEQAPFIHPDDQTLYFCSRGHLGLGASDIFYSRRVNNRSEWDSAINIGYPINTSKEEPGMVVDRTGEYAYYSSDNKDNTLGGIDIYYFALPVKARPKPVTYLKGKVMDIYTKEELFSYFELIDLDKGETLVGNNTTKKGEFLVPVPGGRDYMVNVSRKGYLFYSDNIPMKDYKQAAPYQKDIYLKPIKPGEKITLKNIFFDSDSYRLKEESYTELQRVINFLNENPTVRIEVSGHTDNTGTPAHNKELSNNRAKSVQEYLISKGSINPSRLTFKGYGETQPVATNDTVEGKAQNRRTEMQVIQ